MSRAYCIPDREERDHCYSSSPPVLCLSSVISSPRTRNMYRSSLYASLHRDGPSDTRRHDGLSYTRHHDGLSDTLRHDGLSHSLHRGGSCLPGRARCGSHCYRQDSVLPFHNHLATDNRIYYMYKTPHTLAHHTPRSPGPARPMPLSRRPAHPTLPS